MGNRLVSRPRSRRARRRGRSPYAKYNKKPTRYSSRYQDWRGRFRVIGKHAPLATQ